MDDSKKLQWLAAFSAALRACAVPEEAIANVGDSIWHSAGLLDPEHAAAEYTAMLVSAGMKERRRSWRGWPATEPDSLAAGAQDSAPLLPP